MKEVRVFVHDGRIYQVPYHIYTDEVMSCIRNWKESVLQIAKDANADHFVYCTINYEDDGVTTKEVNLYTVPLNDEEFYKRTDSIRNAYIGAWHKGTTY